MVPPSIRKSRKHLRGSGIGKLWMAEDAFSPETDLEIQKLFEADDPHLENLGKKTCAQVEARMRVLVDTHTFLWDLADDPRSSRMAREFFSSDEHQLVFSLVSLWEIAIKLKTGKLNTIGSSVAYIRDEMDNYSMELLLIRYEHILGLESLPHYAHADAFDRLLIAQALTEDLPILTGDRAFKQYGVKTIW